MRRELRLRRKSEFLAVQRRGRWWSNSLLVLRVLPNDLDVSRSGFLVSKRVGGAVVRNLVKRRLREIVRRSAVAGGWDLVFIAKKATSIAGFGDVQGAARDLMKRARLLTEGEVEAQPAKGRL